MTEQTEQTFWSMTEDPPDYAEAASNLAHWSTNYDSPGPFTLYLDLIGFSEDEYGEPMFSGSLSEKIGYLEADMLGKALVEYAEAPLAVKDWLRELIAVDH